MKVFTLYDRKVGEYGALVVSSTDEAVVRALKDGIPVTSTEGKYPDDFDLVCVGEFDAVTGELQGLKMPRVVYRLSAILRPEVSDA